MKAVKKLVFSVSLVFLIIPVLFAGTNPVYAAEKVYNLTMQAGWPRVDPSFGILDVLIKSADERSKGRIKIKAFGDPEIVPADQLLDAVKLGTVDMMHSVGLYWEGIIPIGGAEFGLPMAYLIPWKDTYQEKAKELRDFYFNSGMIDILREEYAKHGHYYLDIFTSGSDLVLSKEPLKNMRDWKGKKIRTDGINITYYNHLGAKGTPIPGTEAYMSLKLGVIDAAHWDVGAIRGLKWYEVAPYWNKGFETNIVCNLTINLDIWNSMPEDLKEALRGAAEDYWYAAIEMYKKEFIHAEKLAEEGKIKMVTVDDETHQAFKESAKIIWDQAAKKDPATAKAITLIREWIASHPE
jgi:TRAP-type mannitol/chloroaromatic compound transport system substrate-binding protein